MLFYVDLLQSPSSISLYPSPLQKNFSDLREYHDPTRPRQAGQLGTATLLDITDGAVNYTNKWIIGAH